MNTNEFKTYHPIVNFVYFVFVIGFSIVFMHPICLSVSLLSGFVYLVMLKGKESVKISLFYMLSMMIVMALANPVFNHEGVTIISYLPGGNPLTLESIIYGICSSVMMISVICHFSCYNEIMTSDKFIYLFGKVIPSMSLILSMTLRFIPRVAAQLKVISNAQKCIGRDVSNGSIIQRIKHGLSILSVVLTWSFENAIETSDSMKSRGYRLPGRTAFSIFNFDSRDRKVLYCIIILGVYVLFGGFLGGMYFRYFPSIKTAELSLFRISVFTAYLILHLIPIIIEVTEVVKWKSIK